MDPDIKEILDKMIKVIDSSSKEHKKGVHKFICFANRRLHKLIKKLDIPDTFGAIGASTAIREKYQRKFGDFGSFY